MKTSEAISRFLRAQEHLQANSLKSYSDCLQRLDLFTAGQDLSDLDREELGQFKWFLNETYQTGTVEYTATIVKVFLNFCYENGWSKLRSSAIKRKRVVNKQKEFVRDYEFEVMLAAADSLRDKTIISILWDTGIRVSELCDLQIKDLHQNGATIYRRKAKTYQRVYWQDETELLVTLLTDEVSEFLFVSIHNETPLNSRTIERIVAKYRPREVITPHSFRHAKAYYMIKNGANLVDVKIALGHTSSSTTDDHYCVWFEDIARQRNQQFQHPRLQEVDNFGYSIDTYGRITKERKSKLRNVTTV